MKISPLLAALVAMVALAGARAEAPQQSGSPVDAAEYGIEERSTERGWVELLVDVGEWVRAGQRIAIQRNALGRVVQEYTAGVSGEVSITARHASTPGDTVLEILIHNGNKPCANADCAKPGNSGQ